MWKPSKPFFTILDFTEAPEVLGVGAVAVAQFCSMAARMKDEGGSLPGALSLTTVMQGHIIKS